MSDDNVKKMPDPKATRLGSLLFELTKNYIKASNGFDPSQEMGVFIGNVSMVFVSKKPNPQDQVAGAFSFIQSVNYYASQTVMSMVDEANKHRKGDGSDAEKA